jgi:hypothetical protein
MSHHGHRHHGGALPGLTGLRLGDAVNTVLKGSLGAGLAVIGAYLLQRGSQQADLAARLDRLEAMLKDLDRKGGSDAGG